MAYVELELHDSLPERVRFVIREVVEPLLRDVHRMLAMPAEPKILPHGGQMQQSIALVLLATVAGVSKTLLYVPPREPAGGDRVRFTQCLIRFFPWDLDPPTGVCPEQASEILYKVFRNPLVHCLGTHRSSDPPVRIGRGHAGEDGERGVEELERMTDKPVSEPCLVVSPKGRTLWLEPFYWGVRILVERWSRDQDEVARADLRLTKRVDDR